MTKYNKATARTPDQLDRMNGLEARGVCAFCREHIETEMDQPIEHETAHWIVKKNDYPYDGATLHLLLIPHSHVRSLGQLSTEARADLMETIAACETWYDLNHYAVGIRSGDMQRTGGSVDHLHAHIVVGDTDDPGHEPVRFKMSSRPPVHDIEE